MLYRTNYQLVCLHLFCHWLLLLLRGRI